MATFGIDGLVSGLDTTSLINQLMQVEAGPQTLLKTKSTNVKALVAGLQGLNTRVASLATNATTAATPASWTAWTASSSATSATATASSTAQPGTLSLTVDAVATTQMSLSAAFTDVTTLFPPEQLAITIKNLDDGTLVTVEPVSGDLAAVTQAINDAAESGIKATAVRVSSAEPPQYRLQFTGSTTGATGAFAVYAGTAAEVIAETATRIDDNQVRAAADATITLWKGTALEQSISQSSNVFTGIMTGVDVTVSQVTAVDEDPVTITVAQDVAALKKLASDMVGSLNVVFSEIASRTKSTTTTASDGSSQVVGGLFTGDNAVRMLNQQLLVAASYPVDGDSPATVGIVLAKDGTFTFDETVFAAALAADPARVQSVVSQLAARVETIATDVSDPYEGSLTLKITGQESLVREYGLQIESWDLRLEQRRAGLQATYAALEVTLSNLNAQSSWLAGQINALTATTSA